MEFVLNKNQVASLGKRVREIFFRINALTLVLILISASSISIAIYSTFTQAKLRSLVEIQSAKISELIKAKKDLSYFGATKEDQNAASLEELTSLVKELIKYKNEQQASSQVLGSSLSVTGAPAIGSETVTTPRPELLGMVRVNEGTSAVVNIYDNPNGNVITTATSSSFLFYYQKEPGWYQVELGPNQFGWIQTDFVTDFSI